MLSEAFAYHQNNLREKPELFGEMVRARFRTGGLFASSDYAQAQRVRNVLKRQFAQVLREVDVIASPTMSNPAPRFDQMDAMTTSRSPSFTGPYNLTGMPAISTPCGFTQSGLPVGLQIAGKPFGTNRRSSTSPTPTNVAPAYSKPDHPFHDNQSIMPRPLSLRADKGRQNRNQL